MAVERNDIEMLELIKARESRKIGIYGINKYNENEKKQTCFLSEIISIANTDNEEIIEYFTGEYYRKAPFGWQNDDISYSMVMHIYMGEVAAIMLKYGQTKFLLKVLRAIYEHDRAVRDEFQKRFDEAYDEYNGEELNFVYLLHKVLEISEDGKIISIRSCFKSLLLFTNIIRINVDGIKLEDEHIKSYILS